MFKIIKTNIQSELLLLFTLMVAFLILSSEANIYQLNLLNFEIGLGILFYPWTILIANITTKKYGENKTVLLILISAFIWLMYFVFVSLLPGNAFEFNIILANIGSFIIVQTVNLVIYNKLLNNNCLTSLNLSLLYLLVITLSSAIEMIGIFSIFHFIEQLPLYIIINFAELLIVLLVIFAERISLKKDLL